MHLQSLWALWKYSKIRRPLYSSIKRSQRKNLHFLVALVYVFEFRINGYGLLEISSSNIRMSPEKILAGSVPLCPQENGRYYFEELPNWGSIHSKHDGHKYESGGS